MKLFIAALAAMMLSANASANLITVNFYDEIRLYEQIEITGDEPSSLLSARISASISDIFGGGVTPLSGTVRLTWTALTLASSNLFFSSPPPQMLSTGSLYGQGSNMYYDARDYDGLNVYGPGEHFYVFTNSLSFDAVEFYEFYDSFTVGAHYTLFGKENDAARVYLVASISTVFTGTIAQVSEPSSIAILLLIFTYAARRRLFKLK